MAMLLYGYYCLGGIYMNIMKLLNKAELSALLNENQKILNKETIDYLNSILNLEFSVVKDGMIDNNARELLSDLEVYRKIAKFNIYNRAINLIRLKFETIDGCLYTKPEIYQDELCIDHCSYGPIFAFDYGTKEKSIGEVVIYDTIFDEKFHEEELERYMEKIYRLMVEKDILLGKREYDDECRQLYIDPRLCDNLDTEQRNKKISDISASISKLENYFNILDNFKLSDKQKKQIETANAFYEVIAEDYGIEKQNTCSGKSLVKKMPGLKIKKDVKTED